ncbi:hypothetical protein Clacol_000940 [Clathrus columnatus]|uniref:Uncharacterized protein n=1 Tax=Clathrus columnatus TaxID=1419009 RepID=A0AAV5A1X8_9AGAM|nr:hypothetical protein Clacol_000940 [Clathrus columnatus]
MSCSSPDLRENLDLGMERQKKILDLITLWYKTAAQTDPPPVTDKSILSYNSKVTYYYTYDVQQKSNISNIVLVGLSAAVAGIIGVVIDFNSIANVVAQSLSDTTQNETGQGYSTCVMRTFEGEFMGIRCLYKPMVVAVSFNFSASEYKTSASVAAFGYWVYLFVTEPPFLAASGEAHHYRHRRYYNPNNNPNPQRFKSVEGQTLAFELPEDMEIVGKKFMTKAELDAYPPTSFTRDH